MSSDKSHPQKAVIFARLSDEDLKDGFALPKSIANLREYALRNNFKILKEFESIENMAFGESPALVKILEFVEQQNEKVILLSEQVHNYNAQSKIGKKLQELIKAEKIEVKARYHPCFREPADPNIKIWRYINLAKFIDLLQNKNLFFTRADFLREADKLEGTYHTKFSKRLNQMLFEKKITLPDNANISADIYLQMEKTSERYNEETFIKQIFVI